MKILVTGATGMLGRHVVEACKAKGWEIDASYRLQNGRPHIDDVFWFIHDWETDGGVSVLNYDVVVHCAGRVGGIGRNTAEPFRQGVANARMGQTIVSSCAHDAGPRPHLINIGSCCQYPADAPLPLKEEDMWSGYPHPTNGPYGVAKRFVCDLVRVSGVPYTNLILANLFGPHDNFDLETSHVIPALIRKFVEAKESGAESVTLWGTGQVHREFLYAKDAADVIVTVIEAGPQNKDVNVPFLEPTNGASAYVLRICDVAEKIRCLVGYEGGIRWDESKPSGVESRYMSRDRIRAIGWIPKYEFTDALRETIEWYKANRVK